ncbi:A/G-specific adenine glycosylase [Cryobacterium sp. BB736]|uniref:A/G-specific adenine glycosylase n=1 Tax=Cryobacterium sp. BB736 TaxID=2746963 RepID=UPI001875BEB9|nr:A/G-specific adenine glycosylase [Cryobacterium sp. BB736]
MTVTRNANSGENALVGAVIEWFVGNARDLPWRSPDCTPWGVLVSEVMLQQTPVSRVLPRFDEWMRRWPSPADLAAEAPGEAVRAWHRLGYPRRALNLHAAAVTITERHRGEVPRDLVSLLALPGVGDYTARAVASFAFGERHPVVDTNVRRVIARAIVGHGEAGPPSTRRDLAAMEALLPAAPADAKLVNAGTMELGALVCTARSPRCDDCPIAGHCAWRAAGRPAYSGPRAAVQKKFEGSDRQVRGLIVAALRQADGLVQHSDLAGLWPDATQFERALRGLLADGLATGTAASGYRLP